MVVLDKGDGGHRAGAQPHTSRSLHLFFKVEKGLAETVGEVFGLVASSVAGSCQEGPAHALCAEISNLLMKRMQHSRNVFPHKNIQKSFVQVILMMKRIMPVAGHIQSPTYVEPAAGK